MAVIHDVPDYPQASPFRPGVTLLVLSLIMIPSYFLILMIYNVYFHPLAKFPGPKSNAATRIPYMYMTMTGNLPHTVKALHNKYGPIVRTAPNELSFITDGQDWKAIYGTRPGHSQKQKDFEFYQDGIDGYPNIIRSNDADHSRFRRLLSHAFSDSSLRGQEPIIQGYVDLLIRRLREMSESDSKPVDLVSWYNFTTFDVIGDLAFGEPFNCLSNSNYHPWVRMVFENVKAGTLAMMSRRLAGAKLLDFLIPKSLIAAKESFDNLTKEMVDERVKKSNDRPDFFANILKHNSTAKGFSHGELYSNTSILIIAGSETTATLLSGATYLLMKNPEAMAKLQEEVRGTFKSDAEINLENCNNLYYINAVLTEALRLYPPVPVGLPRWVDAQGETVAGKFVPGGTIVSISHTATYSSESNFKYADRFLPERHLDDPRFASDNKDALQPFSFGPRNCIGRNLAYVEMRLILSRIIFNFDLALADPDADWMDQKVYALWEKSPLMTKLTPRVV